MIELPTKEEKLQNSKELIKKGYKTKKGKTVKEEFDRIKSLMGYNQKTQ
jgi:hypothetical protein